MGNVQRTAQRGEAAAGRAGGAMHATTFHAAVRMQAVSHYSGSGADEGSLHEVVRGARAPLDTSLNRIHTYV
ncbi:MAG: hypothetical protein ACE5FJ_00435 [Gemmatimonadales bacterium]